jgi:hypothetical protein
MMAAPQQSQPPRKVIKTVSAWLAEAAPEGLALRPPRQLEDELLRVATVEDGLRERIVTVESAGAHLSGVLTEPTARGADVCAIFLNAGAIRRTGPNRMWVDTARRWAAKGVPTLRLDLAGLGDSCGEDSYPLEDGQLYEGRFGQQVSDAMDTLVSMGLPPRFLLMGLCSGAYWSFKLGQTDKRIAGIVMINPLALVFDPFQGTIRTGRNARRLVLPETWQLIVRGRVSRARAVAVARAVAQAAVAAPGRISAHRARRRARLGGGDQLDLELDQLCDNGVIAQLLFTAEEPLRIELAREGRFHHLERWPNLRLHLLEGSIATHTLQAPHVQEQVNAIIDRAVDELVTGPRNEARST